MKTTGITMAAAVALAVWVLPVLAQEKAVSEAGRVREIRRLFTLGQWEEAVKALRAEEKLRPGQEDLQFMSAMVAMETGDYTEAMNLYGLKNIRTMRG
jgi:hypothetical protein